MSLLEKAIAIAVEAHRGQHDKVGAPYILHPLEDNMNLHRLKLVTPKDSERLAKYLAAWRHLRGLADSG
jgi:(p)ppGpp synthase/HD superfamily hydrolase